MGCARPLLQKIQTYFLFLLLLRLFLSEILSRRSRLSRTTNDRSQKVKIFRSKLPFISCFSGKKIGTILSRRSRLSRTSRVPSRLIRPCPIDCDKEPEQMVKIFPRFFGFKISSKKVFFNGSPGGQYSRDECWPNKKFYWRGELVCM